MVVVGAGAHDRARRAVEAELAEIDVACSRFRDDSELAAVNAARGRRVRVSAVLLDALDVALRAAAITDGRVDPTVGGALVLAGYDRDFAAVARRAGAPAARGARRRAGVSSSSIASDGRCACPTASHWISARPRRRLRPTERRSALWPPARRPACS